MGEEMRDFGTAAGKRRSLSGTNCGAVHRVSDSGN
jgi:hypothetical protein